MNPKMPILSGIAALALTIAAGVLTSPSEGERLQAYQDGGGIWTICKGHTQGVHEGDTATPTQCDEYERQDLANASTAFDNCVHEPVTANERAAWLDFIFNVGSSAACRSTAFKLLNAGDHKGACDQLFRWIYPLNEPGLVTRRQKEHDLCVKDLP